MSLAPYLSNALHEISLDLDAIRDPVLRAAVCEVCERLLRWTLQASSSGAIPRAGNAGVMGDCRIAEAYCRRAGLDLHADRLLHVLELLSGASPRTVAQAASGN